MKVPGAVTEPRAITSTDMSIETPRGVVVEGYLARPVATGTRPGVIVLHEAFGLNEHIRDVTRRFANAGFDALAPNLYTRSGAPSEDDISDVLAKMLGLNEAAIVSDLEAAAAHLRSLPGASGSVGCIGFCSGGRQTLLFACTSDAVDAAIDCWGGFIDRASPDEVVTENRPVSPVDVAADLRVPVFVVGGAEDTNPSPEVLADLASRLRAAGRHEVVVRIFDGAGHAFLADYRPAYREGPAHELWPMLVDFFRRHLG